MVRGVFATGRIRRGEVIEVAPVLVVPRHEVSTLLSSFLGQYFFETDRKGGCVLGLGWTSLLNHGPEPNTVFFVTRKALTLKATRSIRSGEELTLCYGWSKAEWRLVGVTPPARVR
jgi:hypothetical protein